jgi:hypothetical protein
MAITQEYKLQEDLGDIKVYPDFRIVQSICYFLKHAGIDVTITYTNTPPKHPFMIHPEPQFVDNACPNSNANAETPIVCAFPPSNANSIPLMVPNSHRVD